MSTEMLERAEQDVQAPGPQATYILPIRRGQIEDVGELTAYLMCVSRTMQVIVVDGSPPEVFEHHAREWGGLAIHVPPEPNPSALNGKVRGVLTGLRLASHERLVIADDDVRYEPETLARIVAMLDHADIIRPQNYFHPLPWHARWDTARILLNRMTGGDWPGTLAVRRSILQATNGYDGGVLFENLEMVRTVLAAGGTEAVPLDLFVRRRPPPDQHFWSQRVRQAYDELARPIRLGVWLGILPLALGLIFTGRWRTLAVLLASTIGLAECGRWRAGGRSVFPLSASLLAPAWVAERAVCSWLALGARLLYGGVPYHGTIIPRPATPMEELRHRHGTARARACRPQQAARPHQRECTSR